MGDDIDTNKKTAASQSVPIQRLMERKVTRKEFLSHAILGLMTLFGLSAVIEFMTGHSHSHSSSHQPVSEASTYGETTYGG